jgi:hypothetical protein
MCVVHTITTNKGCCRLYRSDVDCCDTYKAINNNMDFKTKLVTWRWRVWDVDPAGLSFALVCYDVNVVNGPKGFNGCKSLKLRSCGESMYCTLCDYPEVISKVWKAIDEQEKGKKSGLVSKKGPSWIPMEPL